MQRTDLLKKTLKLGKIEGKKRKVQQRMRWLDSITDLIGGFLSTLPQGKSQKIFYVAFL